MAWIHSMFSSVVDVGGHPDSLSVMCVIVFEHGYPFVRILPQ
jgi:hypothetical protein